MGRSGGAAAVPGRAPAAGLVAGEVAAVGVVPDLCARDGCATPVNGLKGDAPVILPVACTDPWVGRTAVVGENPGRAVAVVAGPRAARGLVIVPGASGLTGEAGEAGLAGDGVKGRAGAAVFGAAGEVPEAPVGAGGRTGAEGAGRPGSTEVRAGDDVVLAGAWAFAPARTGAFGTGGL